MQQVIFEIISRVAKCPTEQVTVATSLVTDLNLDSLDRVELVMALELAFDILLPDELAGSAETVGELVAVVSKLVTE